MNSPSALRQLLSRQSHGNASSPSDHSTRLGTACHQFIPDPRPSSPGAGLVTPPRILAGRLDLGAVTASSRTVDGLRRTAGVSPPAEQVRGGRRRIGRLARSQLGCGVRRFRFLAPRFLLLVVRFLRYVLIFLSSFPFILRPFPPLVFPSAGARFLHIVELQQVAETSQRGLAGLHLIGDGRDRLRPRLGLRRRPGSVFTSLPALGWRRPAARIAADWTAGPAGPEDWPCGPPCRRRISDRRSWTGLPL